MINNITIEGLDTHKNSIDIITAEPLGSREVRHYGKIAGDMASLDRAIRILPFCITPVQKYLRHKLRLFRLVPIILKHGRSKIAKTRFQRSGKRG